MASTTPRSRDPQRAPADRARNLLSTVPMSQATDRSIPHTAVESAPAPERSERPGWQRPSVTVIPLDCEISAYAPDGGDPLF